MAYRLHEMVVRGEIDNTIPGRVTGQIWLAGYTRPLQLDLAGDCWPDMAGRCLQFHNPNPGTECSLPTLAELQCGEVGDITASRKVRVPDLPLDQWLQCKSRGEDAPEHMANALYLEWYSDNNGRVVIESADYQLQISLPKWQMDDEQARRQAALNSEAMQRFLNRLESSLRPPNHAAIPVDREMNEHEWECFLQTADARTTRYGELLDKFYSHPHGELLVNKFMGWSDGDAGVKDDELANAEANDWHALLQPTRRRAHGSSNADKHSQRFLSCDSQEHHPLPKRCQELALRMFFAARQQLDKTQIEGDTDISEMLFQLQACSSKLADVLDIAVQDDGIEPGFVVAMLKRALALLLKALAAADAALTAGCWPQAIPQFKLEMLQLRTEIIDLMQSYRRH